MKIINFKLTAFSSLLLLTACSKDSVKQTAVQSIAANNVTEASLKNNLVAWYTFDGDVLDHSGNGNNVVFNNATPTEGRSGLPNTAYLFDGSSSYMLVPNSTSLQGVAGKGITLAAKFKVKGFYKGACHANRILQKGNDYQTPGVYYLAFDDAAYWNFQQCDQPVASKHENFTGVAGNIPSAASSARTDENVQKGKWYVVVYSYAPKSHIARLYINDNTKPDTALTETKVDYSANYSDLYIGRNESSSYPYWFNGIIDEIRIYNKALTNDEALVVRNKLMAE